VSIGNSFDFDIAVNLLGQLGKNLIAS